MEEDVMKKKKLPKYVDKTMPGRCPICKKEVKALEQHMHDKHKGKKVIK